MYDKKSSFNYLKQIDEYCDMMNKVRDYLAKKTSLARMGEVVASNDEKSIVGTQALDTCYGILFYDRENKKGICGHAVPSNLTAVLNEMIILLGDEKQTIEYMIVPGFRNVERKDFRGFNELESFLFSRVSPNVKLLPLKNDNPGINFHANTLSYEFAFDTTSGEFISEYVFFDEFEYNPRYIPKKKYFYK